MTIESEMAREELESEREALRQQKISEETERQIKDISLREFCDYLERASMDAIEDAMVRNTLHREPKLKALLGLYQAYLFDRSEVPTMLSNFIYWSHREWVEQNWEANQEWGATNS